MSKERPGWTWKKVGEGGYWVREDVKARHSHKLDFFCPHCQRPTGTIDDKYLQEHGICSVCYVMHVESRKKPTINLDKYKKSRKPTS